MSIWRSIANLASTVAPAFGPIGLGVGTAIGVAGAMIPPRMPPPPRPPIAVGNTGRPGLPGPSGGGRYSAAGGIARQVLKWVAVGGGWYSVYDAITGQNLGMRRKKSRGRGLSGRDLKGHRRTMRLLERIGMSPRRATRSAGKGICK